MKRLSRYGIYLLIALAVVVLAISAANSPKTECKQLIDVGGVLSNNGELFVQSKGGGYYHLDWKTNKWSKAEYPGGLFSDFDTFESGPHDGDSVIVSTVNSGIEIANKPMLVCDNS